MKILFAASEARPFIASGGLADVAGALPKALCKQGEDCRVVIPLYAEMKPQYRERLAFVTAFTVQLSWRRQYCGLFTVREGDVIYYFLDNEQYFKRSGLYGYFDDAEQMCIRDRRWCSPILPFLRLSARPCSKRKSKPSVSRGMFHGHRPGP